MTVSVLDPYRESDLIVDSSAVIAVLLQEQETEAVLRCLCEAQRPAIAAPTRTEILVVALAKLGSTGRDRAAAFLEQQRIRTVPCDGDLADAAALAFERFGRGRHPSGLNFGDCFSYALAHHLKLPLLFIGNDFSRTDIEAALLRPDRPTC